jgi:hypothetical protein
MTCLRLDQGLLTIHSQELWEAAREVCSVVVVTEGQRETRALLALAATVRMCAKEGRSEGK